MSTHKRLCVGIRTHKFGAAEQDLYRSLRHFFPQTDIFVVVDETSGPVDVPPVYNKIGFNKDSLSRLSLFSEFKRIGWLCGDYFYYFLHEEVRADTYWLVEPDVRFTFHNVDEFFKLYEEEGADVLLADFERRGAQWPWHSLGLQISDSIYGCAFPLSRLSGRAIELLLKERQAISSNLASRSGTWKDYPNDEVFVATAAMKLGLVCADLSRSRADLFTHFSVFFPYLWPDAQKAIPEGKVVHPALMKNEFWPAFNKKLNRTLKKSDLSRLLDTASAGMDAQDRELLKNAVLSGLLDWMKKNGLGES
jgi:hypothetical protein